MILISRGENHKHFMNYLDIPILVGDSKDYIRMVAEEATYYLFEYTSDDPIIFNHDKKTYMSLCYYSPEFYERFYQSIHDLKVTIILERYWYDNYYLAKIEFKMPWQRKKIVFTVKSSNMYEVILEMRKWFKLNELELNYRRHL